MHQLRWQNTYNNYIHTYKNWEVLQVLWQMTIPYLDYNWE